MHEPSAPHGDPIPEALAESIWLGGEAMIAPYAQSTAPAGERDNGFADPDWHVL
jgi:hypothetical protein